LCSDHPTVRQKTDDAERERRRPSKKSAKYYISAGILCFLLLLLGNLLTSFDTINTVVYSEAEADIKVSVIIKALENLELSARSELS